MNVRWFVRPQRAVKMITIAGFACVLAGCSLFPAPDDTVPVLTTVYPTGVGQDVYSSFSPSHFLE